MGIRTWLVIAMMLTFFPPPPILRERDGVRVRAADLPNSKTLTLPSPGVPEEGKKSDSVGVAGKEKRSDSLGVAGEGEKGTTLLIFRGCAEIADKWVQGLSGVTRVGESDLYWA